MTDRRPNLDEFKQKAFQDKHVKEEYTNLQQEFDLIAELIAARKKTKISQEELATKLHTKQPAIARFENGGFSKASLIKLQNYADALGYKLRIKLIPKNLEKHSG
ncbi:MAG: XRE family transcriptional regulator [Legionella sp.]|nr:XRE family transcriptional regulator [Legionella sp.]